MKISVFDSFFKVTDEMSVATIVIQDKRYCLILEYLNDNAAMLSRGPSSLVVTRPLCIVHLLAKSSMRNDC